jgi:hypothetical protein
MVRLALPWLHEAIVESRSGGTLPAMGAYSWLAGRGNATRAPQAGWRDWLLGGVDSSMRSSLKAWPAGPALAAAAGAGSATALAWAVAQPVHLAAGMDHLRLAPLADATPSVTEAEQLADTLRAHFAGDVFDLLDFMDGAWLVRCVDTIDCATHDPATLAGRNIHDYMPAGQDGARVRSVMNEIQMLLHEHPVNARRASSRSLPINALWLWGFGTFREMPEPLPAASEWVLQTDDLWLRSFWRIHGGAERPLGSGGDGADHRHSLVAMTQPPTTDPSEALAEVDSSLLSRLCRAVQAGDVGMLELHDGSRVHTLDRHSRLRFWRRPLTHERL